jgi:hypothetical protein
MRIMRVCVPHLCERHRAGEQNGAESPSFVSIAFSTAACTHVCARADKNVTAALASFRTGRG